jgi:hypothetical protein
MATHRDTNNAVIKAGNGVAVALVILLLLTRWHVFNLGSFLFRNLLGTFVLISSGKPFGHVVVIREGTTRLCGPT